MAFKNIGGGSSLQGIVNDMNQNINELKNREVTEVFKDDTGTRRVLLGKGADDFYGLKVSKPGFDVYDAADSDLAFNSDQNVFKIVGTGSLTPSDVSLNTGASKYGSNSASVSVAHGLGFSPAFIAFYRVGSANVMLPYTIENTLINSSNGFTQAVLSFDVNETNIYATSRIWGYNTSGTAGSTFSNNSIKYYLLQETSSA